MWRSDLLWVVALGACGTPAEDPGDLLSRDGGVVRDGGSISADAGARDAGARDAGVADAGFADAGVVDAGLGDPFAEIDRIATEAIAAAGNPGVGLAIYDADDNLVFQKMYGDFAPDRRVAVASASKIIAGAVIFDVIDRGLLTLDSTTGDILGWTGTNRDITLRHLLSFTSGLEREASCTRQAGITLAECVDTIRDTPTVAPPGTRFDYGSAHLHVAARMAEVVTGQTWNALFRAVLADPLGLAADVQFFTGPRQGIGTMNPLIAGGLRTSMDEYAAMWATIFHRGVYDGLDIGTPALFDAQTIEPYPSVTIGQSPVQAVGLPFRYGLTAWLECDTPATGCDVISSPGAFGWTPWMDRAAGYYAILGMEGATGPGVVAFSVDLAQQLKPAIVAALHP